MRLAALCGVLCLGLIAGYFSLSNSLGRLDSYATRDCVIEPDAERPFAAKVALAFGQAEEQGGWLVIGPKLCTMVPPVVEVALRATDPDVAPHISAIDRTQEPYYQGCFVDRDGVQNAIQVSRGWSDARASKEYLAMISSGIVSGEWRFFSDSPLRTPFSLQYLGGACADVPYADQLASSHAAFITHYDAFVRGNARYVTCAEGEPLMTAQWASVYEDIDIGAPANAWHAFELFLMAVGSGRYEGASLTEKGTPRPPFCVYNEPDD